MEDVEGPTNQRRIFRKDRETTRGKHSAKLTEKAQTW